MFLLPNLMCMQGLGLEVLAQILNLTSPSHVMQLQTDNPNNNLPADLWWHADAAGSHAQSLLCQLPSASLCQQELTVASPGTLYNTASTTALHNATLHLDLHCTKQHCI